MAELRSRSTRVKGRFFPELEGPALQRALKTSASPKETLGYRDARRVMFTEVDGDSGKVRCVYTQRAIETPEGIPDADKGAKMNCEHTWPKSKGVKGTPAKSDLHHLFPTDAYANARRGNFPFGIVEKIQWSTDCGAKVGWSATGEIVFEPPEDHRGDVARAMFYIATIYGLSIGQGQADVLRDWHELDPPDAAERARNDRIERIQGNRNPFVDDPDLVRRL